MHKSLAKNLYFSFGNLYLRALPARIIKAKNISTFLCKTFTTQFPYIDKPEKGGDGGFENVLVQITWKFV